MRRHNVDASTNRWTYSCFARMLAFPQPTRYHSSSVAACSKPRIRDQPGNQKRFPQKSGDHGLFKHWLAVCTPGLSFRMKPSPSTGPRRAHCLHRCTCVRRDGHGSARGLDSRRVSSRRRPTRGRRRSCQPGSASTARCKLSWHQLWRSQVVHVAMAPYRVHLIEVRLFIFSTIVSVLGITAIL